MKEEYSDYFVQISEDSEHPQWIELGTLLQPVFAKLIEDEPFLEECIRLFKTKQIMTFTKINEIIKADAVIK